MLCKLWGRITSAVTVDAAETMRADGATLLDVRTPAEWRAGRAPGARHIPLDALETRLGEIPADRPVVVICRSGARSARGAALLRARGFTAATIRGGMRAWEGSGREVRASGGRPGSVA